MQSGSGEHVSLPELSPCPRAWGRGAGSLESVSNQGLRPLSHQKPKGPSLRKDTPGFPGVRVRPKASRRTQRMTVSQREKRSCCRGACGLPLRATLSHQDTSWGSPA